MILVHEGQHIAEDAPYQSVMQFEAPQTAEMLGTFLAEQTLSEVPVFGFENDDVEARLQNALRNTPVASTTVERVDKIGAPLPESFYNATSVAQKLRSLRTYVREDHEAPQPVDGAMPRNGDGNPLGNGPTDISLASNSLGSCRDIHEGLLSMLVAVKGLPREAQSIVDHTMLFRAKERYLFDAATNRNIVADDPWKRFVWDWIAGKSSVRAGSRTRVLLTCAKMPSIPPTTEACC